jgi:hypothetical protein
LIERNLQKPRGMGDPEECDAVFCRATIENNSQLAASFDGTSGMSLFWLRQDVAIR